VATVSAETILRASGVLEKPEPEWALGSYRVFMSRGNQLLGTYEALKWYRQQEHAHYGGRADQPSWDAHHVFEDRELDYLGVRGKFPLREQCLCVLIPSAAHKRINSVFAAHTRRFRDVSGILQGYRLAHSMLGDYSGSSPGTVAAELDRIVRAAFRCAGLVA
jgi:hypothetical protein